MGYSEMFDEQYKGKPNDNLVERYITLAEDERIVGELLKWEEKTIDEDKEPVVSYTVMTDNGPASFLLGGATDRQLEGKLHEGDLLAVTYRGKQSIKGGQQQVNLWEIKVIPKGDWKHSEEPGS